LARAADFDIFLLAGRYTLLEQEALTSFLPLCEEKKIAVVIGGPFNSGILATGVKGEARYNYAPASDEVKDRVRRIQQICKGFKVALPEAALRFPLGHPAVVSVIAGAQRASEVRRNAAMMAAKVPAGLWRALKAEKLLREDAPTPR
jgi:D-threo-aldose 1-dehydrogenase